MSKDGILRYCPNCKRLDHQNEAIFCIMCGTELEKISLKDNHFYTQFKIPENKIILEQNDHHEFTGFPFFLRKFDSNDNLLQVIILHEYPNALRLFVKIPARSSSADWSEDIVMTDTLLEELLNQGFEWYHHSEMDTLW